MQETAGSESLFHYPLPCRPITGKRSEHLVFDNPAAADIAPDFFEAGGLAAAIRDWIGPYDSKPDPRPYHEFSLLVQGEMSLTVGGATHIMEVGELAFNPVGVPWRRRLRKGRSARVIYVQLEDVSLWAPLKRHGPYVRAYESADHLFLLMRRMLDAHRYRSVESILLARSHARALVDLLKHEIVIEGKPARPHAAALRVLMDEMHHDPGAEWDVPLLAKRLGVSVRGLYRIFRAEYGKPPKQVVIEQRMNRATEELMTSDATVEAIAQHLGYDSVFSFSRLFRRHVGVSPREYRRRVRH